MRTLPPGSFHTLNTNMTRIFARSYSLFLFPFLTKRRCSRVYRAEDGFDRRLNKNMILLLYLYVLRSRVGEIGLLGLSADQENDAHSDFLILHSYSHQCGMTGVMMIHATGDG